MSQLDIFSFIDQRTPEKTNQIAWIPIDQLLPHPDNPRLIYREDIIETIVQSIQSHGFQPCYALLVRPFNGGYQIISGHTRHKAAQKAGIHSLPCWIKEMDDKTAKAELRKANNQGELSYRERAHHTFNSVRRTQGKAGGKAEDGTFDSLEAYAKDQNISRVTASEEYKVGELNNELRRTCDEVYDRVNQYEVETGKSLGRHQLAISKAPREYWQQLTELLIENEWSVRDTEAIVDAVNKMMALQCPDWLTEIVKFDRAVIAAIKGDDRIYGTMRSCINTALECYESLETITVEIVDGEELRDEDWDLKSMYVQALADTKNIHQNLTPGNFSRPCAKLKQQVEAINKQSSQWKRDRAEGAELERLKAEEQARRERLIQEYKPEGVPGDVKKVLPRMIADQGDSFDLILTDPPYLLSNDGITARGNKQVSVNKNFEDSKTAIAPESWLPFCLQLLKPGGVLVFTCTEHLNITVSRLESQGFEFLERLFWIKRSAPPRLTTTGHRACVEEIWVCRRPGDTHFFNYELLKEKFWGNVQASNYLEFEQCAGNEREGWHDTQKPLKLWKYLIEAYSPIDGKILDPFSGSGTTAVAAKALQRKCLWIEKSQEFYQKALDRIENSPYFWEVQS